MTHSYLRAEMPIRIARPSTNLAAAERFYTSGLGLSVLYRHEVTGDGDAPDLEWSLLMLGIPGAAWHLELADNPKHPTLPAPTAEDLLVIYQDRPVEASFIAALEAAGGQRVASPNPYWNRWGVTILDPDGYRVVLCERGWRPEPTNV